MNHRCHCAAALFDLDGVIVDTAKYHYLAWRRLAQQLGFDFSPAQNELLKGVSRTRSLEILIEIGGLEVDTATREALAAQKNAWYVEYITAMDESELLPGASECLRRLRNKGIKTGLGTASKNAPLILRKLRIESLFDVVVDGIKVTRAKPDPEVFLLGARQLGVEAARCVVFEDAEAGLQAAKTAGMYAVGIGRPDVLTSADMVVPGLHAFQDDTLF